ncbi:RrF2 family transcriptional regulator [Citrobacter werkmanii]|uniref:RrF2 family transcriptional regulator n=1 Tax=Citrobacter werkmanii TaxID=67827 RepID=UPI0037C62022
MKVVFSGKCRVAIAAIVTMISDKEVTTYNLQQIAASVGVSISYLEQVFARLKQSGLVASVRGPGGGYRLNHAIDTLTIGDVTNALEPVDARNTFQTLVGAQLRCIRLHDLVGHVKEIV